MAENAPFRREDIGARSLSLEAEDLRGLREVMRDVLTGGATEDTQEYHQRWGYVVQLFMLGVNRENGTIQTLPAGPVLLEQGHLTMQAWGVMQDMLIAHLNEANKPKNVSMPRTR